MKLIKFTSLALFAVLLGACASAPKEKAPAAPPAPKAAPAAAALNVSGSWQLSVETPMGARDMKLNATQTGETLSGVIATERGDMPVTGTVKGSDIAFMMKVNAQGMDLQIDYTGTLDSPSSMKGKVKLGDFGEGTWTGKKL